MHETYYAARWHAEEEAMVFFILFFLFFLKEIAKEDNDSHEINLIHQYQKEHNAKKLLNTNSDDEHQFQIATVMFLL